MIHLCYSWICFFFCCEFHHVHFDVLKQSHDIDGPSSTINPSYHPPSFTGWARRARSPNHCSTPSRPHPTIHSPVCRYLFKLLILVFNSSIFVLFLGKKETCKHQRKCFTSPVFFFIWGPFCPRLPPSVCSLVIYVVIHGFLITTNIFICVYIHSSNGLLKNVMTRCRDSIVSK